MPSTVSRSPYGGALNRHTVGRPVMRSHGKEWGDMISFLAAYNVQPIYSGVFPSTSTPCGVTFAYQRSPAVKILLVRVEVHNSTLGDGIKVTVTPPSGGALLPDSNPLDGTHTWTLSAARLIQEHRDQYVDVSGVDATTVNEITVSWTNVKSGKGIYRVTAIEVPLADLAIGEAVGLAGGWSQPPNRIVAGTASANRGLVRLIAQMDLARTQVRRHWQIATMETTSDALSRTNTTYGAMAWPAIAGGYDPIFYIRSRRLYDPSSTGHSTVCSVRYKSSLGGTASFQVTANGVATGFALGTSTSFARASNATLLLPTDLTNQEVPLTFQSKATSGTVYVSNVAIIEKEA